MNAKSATSVSPRPAVYIDWDAVLPIGQLAAVGEAPSSYTLHLVDPHWERTHEPTAERPLPARRLLIVHTGTLPIIETKREHMLQILQHIVQVAVDKAVAQALADLQANPQLPLELA